MATAVPAIAPTTLQRLVNDDETPVTIVDVRSPMRYRQNHIDGPNVASVNAQVGQLQATDPGELLDDLPRENVVAVCNTGNQSTMATQLLQRAGIDAQNLQGGMSAWANV